MTYASARARYLSEAVKTVPPGQLVVMLYDALLRNLDQAVVAIRRTDVPAAHTVLVKAQDIVAELDASLDVDRWPGGAGLKQLYAYLEAELMEANITKDDEAVRRCRDLVAPLAEAWRQAAVVATQRAADGAPSETVGGLLRTSA